MSTVLAIKEHSNLKPSDQHGALTDESATFDRLTYTGSTAFPKLSLRRFKSDAILSYSLDDVMAAQRGALAILCADDEIDYEQEGIDLEKGCVHLGIPISYNFGTELNRTLAPQDISEQLHGRVVRFGMTIQYQGAAHVVVSLCIAPRGSANVTDRDENYRQFMRGLKAHMSGNLDEIMSNQWLQDRREFLEAYDRFMGTLTDYCFPKPGEIIPANAEFSCLMLVEAKFILDHSIG